VPSNSENRRLTAIQHGRLNPIYSLGVTVPVLVVTMAALVYTGIAKLSYEQMVADPIVQTVAWVYMPVFIIFLPLGIFYEWHSRTQGSITDTLTNDLRNLANNNESGQPLLEALQTTGQNNDSLLGDEFEKLYTKVQYGQNLGPALIEFNNRYTKPRLSRIVKLIEKAQETSAQIADVLQTAADLSENKDQRVQERISRTRIQVVIILVTFMVFLLMLTGLDVMLLPIIEQTVNDTDRGGQFSSIDTQLASTLFFHSIVIYAAFAGLISGYLQTEKLRYGIKYSLSLMLISLIVWQLGQAI